MNDALKTDTKANCSLALTTRLLIFMAERKLITVDEATKIAHDAGDVAERVGDGIEARMLMDELIASMNRLRP